MVLYQYRCAAGHDSDQFADMEKRGDPRPCPKCGKPATRIITAAHISPDGTYSHDPNIGDADTFERRHEAIKAGGKSWTA